MKKLTIKDHFNRAAKTYDNAATVQKRVADLCAQNVPAGNYPRVLEIGAGSGILTTLLQKKITCEQYTAVDIAPSMLDCIPQTGGLTCLVADGEKLCMEAGTYDLLVSSSTFQWYQNPYESIPANLSFLKPGGRFAFSVFVEGTFQEMDTVSTLTGFGSVYPLLPESFYQNLFTSLPHVYAKFALQKETIYAPSVKEFLTNHRKTGAVYSRTNTFAGKDRYKQFLKTYEEKFSSPEGIAVSYAVLHVWGTAE